MTITLPKELEALVNERIRNGAYRNPEDIIRASLRLLDAREKGLDALRVELTRGLTDIEQGRFTNCSTDEELNSLAEEKIGSAEKESGSPASR